MVRVKYQDKTSEPDGRLLSWRHFGTKLLNGRRSRGVASLEVEQQLTSVFPFRPKKRGNSDMQKETSGERNGVMRFPIVTCGGRHEPILENNCFPPFADGCRFYVSLFVARKGSTLRQHLSMFTFSNG